MLIKPGAEPTFFANPSRSPSEPDAFSACHFDYSGVLGESRPIGVCLPLTSKNRVLPKREKVHYKQYKNKAETDMCDRMRKVIWGSLSSLWGTFGYVPYPQRRTRTDDLYLMSGSRPTGNQAQEIDLQGPSLELCPRLHLATGWS